MMPKGQSCDGGTSRNSSGTVAPSAKIATYSFSANKLIHTVYITMKLYKCLTITAYDLVLENTIVLCHVQMKVFSLVKYRVTFRQKLHMYTRVYGHILSLQLITIL